MVVVALALLALACVLGIPTVVFARRVSQQEYQRFVNRVLEIAPPRKSGRDYTDVFTVLCSSAALGFAYGGLIVVLEVIGAPSTYSLLYYAASCIALAVLAMCVLEYARYLGNRRIWHFVQRGRPDVSLPKIDPGPGQIIVLTACSIAILAAAQLLH